MSAPRIPRRTVTDPVTARGHAMAFASGMHEEKEQEGERSEKSHLEE